MKFHTFGDSHSINGWNFNTDIEIVTHHLGVKLCNSFGRDGLQLLNIKNIHYYYL